MLLVAILFFQTNKTIVVLFRFVSYFFVQNLLNSMKVPQKISSLKKHLISNKTKNKQIERNLDLAKDFSTYIRFKTLTLCCLQFFCGSLRFFATRFFLFFDPHCVIFHIHAMIYWQRNLKVTLQRKKGGNCRTNNWVTEVVATLINWISSVDIFYARHLNEHFGATLTCPHKKHA